VLTDGVGDELPAPFRAQSTSLPFRSRRPSTDDARSRSILAARAAAAKNATETVVLDVGDIIGITEAFVITSGNNVRQVRTIAEEVERKLKEQGASGPTQVEGLSDASWVLLDYGDFVVHVFMGETRSYYDLERLWSDAPRIAWEGQTAAVS
jgi:ribosome-associated protein